MASERDNLKAGLFVIVTAALGMLIALILGWEGFQNLLRPRQTVMVYYPLTTGLQGLALGADVTLGDVPVGTVRGTGDVLDEANGDSRLVGKLVIFKIPRRYQLYWNAQVELVVPLLGSSTTLNIRSVGDRDPYDTDAPMPDDLRQKLLDSDEDMATLPSGAIPGTVASSLTRNLVKSVGFGEIQQTQVQSILENLDATTTDARATVASVRQRSEKWLDRIDSITLNSDEGITAIRKMIDSQVPVIEGVLAKVDEIVTDVQAKSGTLLDTANDGMVDMRKAAKEIAALTVSQRPLIKRTLANLLLASEQLKLATIEVRRAPWRLLSKPGTAELETDNLYDSARSFAQGAASVEAAIASIQSLSTVDRTTYDILAPYMEYLKSLESKFRAAEKRFWEHLNSLE
jgi:hypothetical protein